MSRLTLMSLDFKQTGTSILHLKRNHDSDLFLLDSGHVEPESWEFWWLILICRRLGAAYSSFSIDTTIYLKIILHEFIPA